MVSLSPFDAAQGDPEALEGSNHEQKRSSFDRLRTSGVLTKSAFQNWRRPLVAQAFRPAKRPPGSPEGLRYIQF